ncbi:glycosyltransferase family 39 protein [Bifidobacterium amazonense]|uniref:Glycosyltransferase family 39 protein n=1 Tax=Bifidobacterium amazonense TaxID=2809027 RepID=A0ABS9VWX4_9BIFI|nr:glycosyltransferase family 39 protein [Bifidobacterium amazonense]MCH9276618.1 glycosyltransferase family 39 protein [Bifidobacterium amazonense]
MGRNQSLWFDEQYSLMLASQPVPRLIALTAVDAHPPLYYLLLKAWTLAVGDDVALLRIPNCVCLGLAVGLLVMLMRDLCGARVAMACMPVLMCGGFMLRYGYELRMYSPAMLLAVGGTMLLLRAVGVIGARDCRRLREDAQDDGRSDVGGHDGDGYDDRHGRCRDDDRRRIAWWAAYAVTVTLGMLTLYLTAFVWLTHAIWLAVRSWRMRRLSSWRWLLAWRWLFAYMASIDLFLPWMPTFLSQLDNSVLPPVRRRTNMSGVANAVDVMLLGMTETELPSIVSLLVGVTMTLIVGILIAERLCARTRTLPQPSTSQPPASSLYTSSSRQSTSPQPASQQRVFSRQPVAAAWLIVMLAVVPAALLMLWSAVKELSSGGYGMFSVRYLSIIAPFVYATIVLACVVAYRMRGRRALIIYAVALAILVAGTIVYGVRGNHSFDRNDTPGSAALSRQVVCSAEQPVVAQDEYTYVDAYWYYRDCPYYYFLDANDAPTRGGYAPLHGSTAQLRTIDDLDAERFTLLSWSTTRNYDKRLGDASSRWVQTGVIKRDANAAVSYRRYFR